MITIRGEGIAIHCREDGRGLALEDLRRDATWVLDERTAAWGRASASAWGGPDEPLQVSRPLAARAEGADKLVVQYAAGEGGYEIHYRLRPGFVEVLAPILDGEMPAAVTLPGSFTPEGERPRWLLPIMQGMLWDGRGPAFETVRGEAGHVGFSMAFTGCLSGRGGLLLAAESRDDCRWWFGKAEDGRTWAANLQIASLGALRYPRSARLYFTDPDIVAVAKTYRRKMDEQGQVLTWEEKIAARPALERLFGALMCFTGYCRDDGLDYVESCRALQAMGFDRALLYPSRFNIYYPGIRMGGVPAVDLPPETVAAIRALGYDVAPWSWLNEALTVSDEAHLRGFRVDPTGKTIPNWAIDEQQWYLMCYSHLPGFQQAALRGPVADSTWDHFDVLACVPPMECYDQRHPGHAGRPATRSDDRAWVRATFQADQERGLAVSSENFNDAYLRELDLSSVKAWPQYGPWPFWPVPLTMLAFHDCMIHSWWEVHNYNNPMFGRTRFGGGLFEYGGGRPRLMAALDALMGCPPDVFPFGAQYGYTGRAKETFLFKYRLSDPEVQLALRAALPVARLHRRIGKQAMVHFKILSEDGTLQESAFADGTRVVANFSRDFAGENPLEPEGWRAE